MITIEIVEELIHTAMQTDVGTEVLQETEQPLVLLITLITLPDAGNAKHRTTLREEVEHEQIARLHAIDHLRTGILGPTLNHPDSLRTDTLHGLHHRLASLGVVDIRVVIALMEGIHRIIIGLAEEFRKLIII